MPRQKQPTPAVVKAEEAEKKITAAVGNTNQEQIDRRNAIADSADEFRQAEMEEVDGDKVVLKDPEEARAEEEARESERERARLEAEANEAEARRLQGAGEEESAPTPKRYNIKVNGREVQMTEEELIARASKVESADEYLQTAAEAVKRASALQPSPDVAATDGGAISAEVVTAALQGDAEAIQKIAQRLNGPSRVTPDVLQAVDDRLTFHDAVNWFRGEYKDVVGDPFLYQLVVDQDKRIAEKEPALPYRDRLKKAGDTIRNWKQGFSKASPSQAKLERKASVAPTPAAGGRQSAGTDEDAEEPVESVIDAMAKSRGQNTAIRTPQGMFGKR